jgi:hypothetical protein
MRAAVKVLKVHPITPRAPLRRAIQHIQRCVDTALHSLCAIDDEDEEEEDPPEEERGKAGEDNTDESYAMFRNLKPVDMGDGQNFKGLWPDGKPSLSVLKLLAGPMSADCPVPSLVRQICTPLLLDLDHADTDSAGAIGQASVSAILYESQPRHLKKETLDKVCMYVFTILLFYIVKFLNLPRPY